MILTDAHKEIYIAELHNELDAYDILKFRFS